MPVVCIDLTIGLLLLVVGDECSLFLFPGFTLGLLGGAA